MQVTINLTTEQLEDINSSILDNFDKNELKEFLRDIIIKSFDHKDLMFYLVKDRPVSKLINDIVVKYIEDNLENLISEMLPKLFEKSIKLHLENLIIEKLIWRNDYDKTNPENLTNLFRNKINKIVESEEIGKIILKHSENLVKSLADNIDANKFIAAMFNDAMMNKMTYRIYNDETFRTILTNEMRNKIVGGI